MNDANKYLLQHADSLDDLATSSRKSITVIRKRRT